ncbi:MAG: HK97 family phage prohead protease, partial [Clostridiales bacterium]|nr:HK97 family phage prohead protease [Clostridiales bacterium]
MENYDFRGWATKNNLLCTDGRVIRQNAFAPQDGTTVPLCYGHNHDDVFHILGHALLKNEPEGVRAYCKFNNSEQGQAAKEAVRNGDLDSLSIYAGGLKHDGADVVHGKIVEVSLVLAGANPGAKIEEVFAHDEDAENEGIIWTGESIELAHADTKQEEKPMTDEKKQDSTPKTVEEVYSTLNEEQKTLVEALVGAVIIEETLNEGEETTKEEDTVKHNFFEGNAAEKQYGPTLTHADGEEIIKLAKNSSVGSLKTAIEIFAQNDETLSHGFDGETIGQLFPDYKDVKPGAPELVTRDQGWITAVMNGVHKSPISRIRTRQMDIRDLDGTGDLRGKGYNRDKNGGRKSPIGDAKLLSRTTDPQTVFVLDSIHRDDVIDITDFDVVQYQYNIMKLLLNEEVALGIMIGDGLDENAENKIHDDHIRNIWQDDELYTIHRDVDIEAARAEIQGTNTSANFGENYIYAEAIIQAALYAREDYKGSGQLDFYCTPHLLNVMLLARDLNGRRIYDSKSDLAKA